MKVSLQVKLTALFALLVLVLVLGASTLYVYGFVKETVHEVEQRVDYFLESTTRVVMAVEQTARLPAGTNPGDIEKIRSSVQARPSGGRPAADPG